MTIYAKKKMETTPGQVMEVMVMPTTDDNVIEMNPHRATIQVVEKCTRCESLLAARDKRKRRFRASLKALPYMLIVWPWLFYAMTFQLAPFLVLSAFAAYANIAIVSMIWVDTE